MSEISISSLPILNTGNMTNDTVVVIISGTKTYKVKASTLFAYFAA